MENDQLKLKCSVIIPARNAAKTLAACLEAVFAARPTPDEVIVVNDASEDATAGIAARYPCRILDVDLRQGPMQPRAAAVAHAHYPVLIFLDADVQIYPDTLAKILKHFQTSGVHAVTGMLDPAAGHGFFSRYKNAYMHFIFSRQPRVSSFLYGSLWAVRKQDFIFFEPITQPWGSLVSDSEMGMELKRRDKQIVLDHDLAVRHLKEYSFRSILQNDFKIPFLFALMFLKYQSHLPWIAGRSFSHASWLQVIGNVSVAFALGCGVLAVERPDDLLGWAAGFFSLVFYAIWFPFLRRIQKWYSGWFAIQAMLFLPLDALVMFGGMAGGFFYWFLKFFQTTMAATFQKGEIPHA
jgi:glycosyltransferase involved in cell wall biosynthesis